jgi:hypothetical protein
MDAQLVRWLKDLLGNYLFQPRALTGSAAQRRLEQAAQEITRLKVEVEKQARRMGQYFRNQPMLEGTEATDSKPDHRTTPLKSSTRSSKRTCLSLKTSKTYRLRWNNSARLRKIYLSKQPYSRLAWR